jgi:hypothetical protein
MRDDFEVLDGHGCKSITQNTEIHDDKERRARMCPQGFALHKLHVEPLL